MPVAGYGLLWYGQYSRQAQQEMGSGSSSSVGWVKEGKRRGGQSSKMIGNRAEWSSACRLGSPHSV
jgi:hypothetical protein